MRSKEATPLSSQATASPSMMQERERRRANVSTISGKRWVRSLPGRLYSLTCAPVLRAIMRKPSCLISCSHWPPEGSLSVLVGRHGAMNPAGRVRIRSMDREHRATAAKCESDRGKSPGDLSLPGWFKTAPSVARHSAHRRYHRPSIVLLKDFGDASMANDEHVALLDKGVATWNEWRDKNPDIRPDLSGANFFWGGPHWGGPPGGGPWRPGRGK